jgi:uncharacterized repeat protein (TIGR01451 family)
MLHLKNITMKKLKYIIATCISWCLLLAAGAQTQTLGINQTQSGNPSNSCNACYTVTVQYSISNIAATGTTVVCTIPNNVVDFCSNGGAVVSTLGTTTTLTFNLGNQPTSANSVSYSVRFKPGVTCNGTNGIFNASISTNEHPVAVASTPLTITAVATEGWSVTKYIATNSYQWYSGYTAANPFQYIVSICGTMVDVYYHIRVSNSGCINVTNTSVTDNLPAGATVVGVHTGWPTVAGNLIPSTTGVSTVTWNAGNTSNTLDAATGAYEYYIHLQFPVSNLNTTKCNTATLNGTNFCTNAAKTITSASECITLIGAYPGTSCGNFGTPYYLNYSPYFFIGCPAWLNISLSQSNQCSGATTTLNNLSYNAPIPSQIHVDSFRMNAIPAGKTVAITVNTTACGSFTHTYNGTLPASTINFYAAPFNIPAACVITNFSLTSNMGITGNAIQDFGQLYFTVLANTWATSAAIPSGTTVTMTGAAYTSSNGTYACAPSFVTSDKMPKIETIKDFCSYNAYYNCLNPNDTIRYSIAVHNYGTGNFTGGSIKDVLPVGLQYVPNSSTFGKYTNYTKCNAINQNTTGISVAHIEAAATTNLQWNLPILTADCNNGSDWFIINFKVVVTTAAPSGLITNHEDCFDGNNALITEYNTWDNNASLYICERKVPLEITKDVSADSTRWDSCITVSPGATVYYRLKIKNTGNVAFSNIRMMDLLPTASDKYVVNCLTRGSTIPIYLTSALPLGNASTIDYSTNPSPLRGAYLNLIPDNTIPCSTAATWSPYSGIAATIQNQKAIRIDFGSYSLGAGQTETYYFSAQVPPGAPVGSVGWNSFAATASQNTVQTLGAESRKVCVNIIETGCGCIGDFVWFDTNGNGLQDAGEVGINGAVITLYDAANNPVGLPHISTYNISSQPGYYQFCGLTAGTYHIGVTPPAGYMFTTQNNTNNSLNSDINPVTGMSANFQFDCKDDNNLDIGLVLDDGCNCNQSHWGNIVISDNNIAIDNPSSYDAMPVNRLNKNAAAVNLKMGIVKGEPIQQPDVDMSVIGLSSFSQKLNCGKKDTITLQCKTKYNFSANYICSSSKCGSAQIVLTTPSGTSATSTNLASFITTDGGFYTLKIYGKCGNKICDSCVFTFKVICPFCVCEYKLAVTPTKNAQTVINTNPQYTLYNQGFNITAPAGALFTQVRAEVVSFNLIGNYNNECISCKNLPYTWGSIYNASDINTNAAVADSITMGLNPPVTQFTPTVSNTYQNPRETIWDSYSGFTLPPNLNMQFVLPHPSAIGCCTLYVRICVKFTFRDRNCKECEVISCFTVAIPPTAQNGHATDNPQEISDMGPIKNTGCATCGSNGAANNNNNVLATLPQDKSTALFVAVLPTDEEIIALTEQKIKELKQLKEKGFKRGDVELLPQLEKQLTILKEKGKAKK